MAEEDDLERWWREANRVPGDIAHTDASRELMDDIRALIVASDRPVRNRRWRLGLPSARRGVVLAWVIGAVVVGGAAAGTLALTYTVDGAPRSCQTLSAATANIPYPAGDQAWRNWILLESIDPKLRMSLHKACETREYMGHGADRGPAAELISVFKGEVASSAFCGWASDWLRAKRSGDRASESQAAHEIEGALKWPEVRVIVRAHPGNLNYWYLSWFIPAQRAVRAGDATKVASLWSNTAKGPTAYQCWFFQPPAHSKNGTVFVPRSPRHLRRPKSHAKA